MKNQLIPIERVEKLILLLRGEKVLLGQQLAELYGVPVKVLIQAVKRNRNRFPEDFMFQLSREEFDHLKSQFVTSNSGGALRSQFVTLKRGQHLKYLPYAFTEQGVAMLSSVLRSERAVQVNVAIMRAFVSLRRMLAGNEALAQKLAELERRLEGHDASIRTLFDALRELAAPPTKPPREIGFHVKEDSVSYRVKRK
ncbi:MAG: ORF6N domain-containing protein [Verrucomicrobiota bacterium]